MNRFFIDYFSGKMPPEVKKKWYVDILPGNITTRHDGTRLLPDDVLEEEKYMMEDPGIFEQEYLCSFNAVNPGAFYKDQIREAFEDQRITEFGNFADVNNYTNYFNKNAPLYISWDLGFRDNTVLWFFQITKQGKMRFIHHHRNKGRGMEYYSDYIKNWCKDNGATGYTESILPHDGDNTEWASASKRSDRLKELGHNVFTLTKGDMARNDMQRLISQINLVRKEWKNIEIDYHECFEGVDKLTNYVKKYNKNTGEYSDKPDHDANDKASDDADSFRTGVLYYSLYLKNAGVTHRDSYVPLEGFEYEDLSEAYDY